MSGGNPYVVSLSLSQYLLIMGRGTARNSSFTIPAGPIIATDSSSFVTTPVAPDSNDGYILLRNVQFDGVQSGMVGYELVLDNGSEISGFAVQGIPDVIELLCARALRFSIQSTQTTPVVVNFDYVSLKTDVVNSLIFGPLFNLQNEAGGPFGVARVTG